MRRVASRIASLASAATVARRLYTPPADMKALYQSAFDREAFPVEIVPSDSTLFAKFLYKAAEKNNGFDAVLKDFNAIEATSKKLPVFWERTAKVDDIKEFASLSPAVLFTLNWMGANGMLEALPAVRTAFETYVNAKNKKVIAKIYVAPGKEADAATVNEAKAAAQQLHKGNAAVSGFALEFKVAADPEIVSGFAVDVGGAYASTAKGADAQGAAGAAREVDYTQVPASKVSKTKWADSVETEVLRKYFEQLALYDAEEAKVGV